MSVNLHSYCDVTALLVIFLHLAQSLNQLKVKFHNLRYL